MNPLISFIIVNYNGKKWLKRCLESIDKQTYPREKREIIIVDNASTDDSVKYIRQHFPTVKLITSPENLGFSGGNNLGVAQSQGKYVVLLNNDAVLDTGWLKAVLKQVEADQQVKAVNGKTLLERDHQVLGIQNAGSIVFRTGFGRDRGAVVEGYEQTYEAVTTPFYDHPQAVTAFCGVSVLIEKEAYQFVGGFDERFFMYYEDTDMSLQFRRLGWKILYEPSAITYHQHAASSGENSAFFLYHVEKNRLALVWKHLSESRIFQETVWFIAQFLVSVLRWLKHRLRHRWSEAQDWKQRSLWRGKALLWLTTTIPYLLQERSRIDRQSVVERKVLERELY